MGSSLCCRTGRPWSRGTAPNPSPWIRPDPFRLPGEVVLVDLFEGLVSEDGQGRIVPAQAQRWETSEDGLVALLPAPPAQVVQR